MLKRRLKFKPITSPAAALTYAKLMGKRGDWDAKFGIGDELWNLRNRNDKSSNSIS